MNEALSQEQLTGAMTLTAAEIADRVGRFPLLGPDKFVMEIDLRRAFGEIDQLRERVRVLEFDNGAQERLLKSLGHGRLSNGP